MSSTDVVSAPESEPGKATARPSPRIGILIVAYNAAATLAKVLDRIPKEFRPNIAEVIVSDDSSTDSTYLVGLGYQQAVDDLPLTVLRNAKNLGYGGNQKVGYRWAMEHDLDIVVLLHGDGQYAPEFLPAMVAPLESGVVDAVFGSRMLETRAARKGRMPIYKYVGNRILTTLENKALGTSLSEFHSGYRAYRVDSLRRLAFESYSDDFDFDTEIIIGMVDKRMRIEEIPIPTFYGNEICYVNGMRYASQVLQHVLTYRFQTAMEPGGSTAEDGGRPSPTRVTAASAQGSVASGPAANGHDPDGPNGHGAGDPAAGDLDDRDRMERSLDGGYPFKWHPLSSHGRLLARADSDRPLRILDLGCAAGLLSDQLRRRGHHVTGVDHQKAGGVDGRTDAFFLADLGSGLPDGLAGPFDLVILGDVLEHLRHPEVLLTQLHGMLAERGALLVSVPNFGHWYPRARVLFGVFGYDRRGILDEDHVRFFTRRTIQRLFSSTGWHVVRREAVGVPWEELLSDGGTAQRAARVIERVALMARETLFGYQFLFELVEATHTVRADGGDAEHVPVLVTAGEPAEVAKPAASTAPIRAGRPRRT